MEYNSQDQTQIVEFLEICIKLVKSGNIANYKDSISRYNLEFTIKPKEIIPI